MKSRLYNTFYETSFPIQTSVEIFMMLGAQYDPQVKIPFVVIHLLYCMTYYIIKNSKQLKKNITESLLTIQDESYISSKYIFNEITNVYWNDMKYEIKMNVDQIKQRLHSCCHSSRQEWTELYQKHHRLNDKGFQLKERKYTLFFQLLMLISLQLCNKYTLPLHLLYNKMVYTITSNNANNISLHIFIYKISLSYFHLLLCMENDFFDINTLVISIIISTICISSGKIEGCHHIINGCMTWISCYINLTNELLLSSFVSFLYFMPLCIRARTSKVNIFNQLFS